MGRLKRQLRVKRKGETKESQAKIQMNNQKDELKDKLDKLPIYTNKLERLYIVHE